MLGLGLELGRVCTVAAGTGPVYDPDAEALFAAMAEPPLAARKQLYSDLIAGLKTDGVWARLDVLYILAAHSQQAALLNVRNPALFTGAPVNSPVFAMDRGYQGGGTSYIDTNFNPAIAGGQFAQNSAHLMAYINAANPDTGNSAAMIGRAGNVEIFLRPRTSANAVEGRVNSGANQSFGLGAVLTRLGGRILSRINSADTRAYVNGAQAGSINGTAGAPVASEAITLLRLTTTYATADRLAAASMGGGLTETEAAALHGRVSAFLAAIGAN